MNSYSLSSLVTKGNENTNDQLWDVFTSSGKLCPGIISYVWAAETIYNLLWQVKTSSDLSWIVITSKN